MCSSDLVVVEINKLEEGLSITVVADDKTGLLGEIAAVLSLDRLLVRSARTETLENRAVTTWRVTPEFGDAPDVAHLTQNLNLALKGNLDVFAKLAERAKYLPKNTISFPSKVLELQNVSKTSTVIEVRAHDEPGFLSKIAHAITDQGVDIHAAKIGRAHV